MRVGWGVRIAMVVAIGAAGAAWAQGRAQSKADTTQAGVRYEIRGVVVNAVDGSPVPHCRLTPALARAGRSGRQFPASVGVFEADEQGKFSIALPSAGEWRLSASARGFVTQAYEEHGNFSSAVVVTAAAPVAELRFRLGPEAIVAGVVLDEAGEAVRGAQVSLQLAPKAIPGGPQPAGGMRGATQTDDRGMYEFDGVKPGAYRVRLEARPWYAAISDSAARGPAAGGNSAPLDPSLDFAYPVTWFPGVDDAAQGEVLEIHAGDRRQADFHLTPIPSIHLKIAPEARGDTQGFGVLVEQVSPGGGGPEFVPATVHRDEHGQMDVGGLTPGLYQIRLMGPNQGSGSTLVNVTANSARTIDLSSPPGDVARITLHFDGVDDADAEPGFRRGGPMQVNLIDVDGRGGRFSSGGSGLARRASAGQGADRTMEVPPGRYEVVLQGRPNVFLTGLSAKGAEISGRNVTVAAGETTLILHVATGLASVSGVATMAGKPRVGAMILLVPVTVEEPGSITILRRDQTNTDGSFDLDDVIPGRYILVAIDHGWEINWGDRSTLRRYLMQGVPVELRSSAVVRQDVVAQSQ